MKSGLFNAAFSMPFLILMFVGVFTIQSDAAPVQPQWRIDFALSNGDDLQMFVNLGAQQPDGLYKIDSLAGTDFTSGNSLSLDPNTVSHSATGGGTFSTDNEFNPTNSPAWLDRNGLAYFENGETEAYALYYNPNVTSMYEGCWEHTCVSSPIFFRVTRIRVTPVPEPSSILLLGLGALALLLFSRRTKRLNKMSGERG